MSILFRNPEAKTEIPERACKKPCYDCPFRSDYPSYMTPIQVFNNVAATGNQEGLALCHHGGKHYDRAPARVCAGFLLFVHRNRLSNSWLITHREELPHCETPIHSIASLLRAGVDNAYKARLRYLCIQPKHVQNRELNKDFVDAMLGEY